VSYTFLQGENAAERVRKVWRYQRGNQKISKG